MSLTPLYIPEIFMLESRAIAIIGFIALITLLRYTYTDVKRRVIDERPSYLITGMISITYLLFAGVVYFLIATVVSLLASNLLQKHFAFGDRLVFTWLILYFGIYGLIVSAAWIVLFLLVHLAVMLLYRLAGSTATHYPGMISIILSYLAVMVGLWWFGW